MLKASISYTRKDAPTGLLTIEMRSMQFPLLRLSGMELVFAIQHAGQPNTRAFCKMGFEGYNAWSESPLALSLRALATFYTECHDSIPAELIEGEVTAMTISIDYAPVEKMATSNLMSVSLTMDATQGSVYLISHPGEGRSVWPIESPSPDAHVMCIALKLLAFEQATGIDIHRYPAAPKAHIGPNVLQHRKSIEELIPEYAREAFRVFMALSKRPPNSHYLVGRIKLWELFLRT
jgi:hypothetical protein